ncbi:MAG: PEP-CTERM sorting domain-containing protein [Cyanobacteria bacterium J06592_8]
MQSFLNKYSFSTLITTLTVAVTAPAQALIINGGFETGDFTGWQTIGDSSIETNAFGTGPTEGTFQALVTTDFGSNSDRAIENFLNLSNGTLDNLSTTNATQGSAISQTFDVTAGQTLSFRWNFLTDEFTPTVFNDMAFVSLAGVGQKLADTNSTFVLSSVSSFNEETGFATFSKTFDTSETIKLGIGVLDVLDSAVDSGLLIDEVTLTPKNIDPKPVPEPLSILGSLTALVFGAVMKKKS